MKSNAVFVQVCRVCVCVCVCKEWEFYLFFAQRQCVRGVKKKKGGYLPSKAESESGAINKIKILFWSY